MYICVFYYVWILCIKNSSIPYTEKHEDIATKQGYWCSLWYEFDVMNVDVIVMLVLFQGNHNSITKVFTAISTNCNMEMNGLNRTVLKIDSTMWHSLHCMYIINVLRHFTFMHLMYEMHHFTLVLYKESILHVSFDCFFGYKIALLEYIDLLKC